MAAVVTAVTRTVRFRLTKRPWRTGRADGGPLASSTMTNPLVNNASDTGQKNFENLLSREPFTGLKALLDALSRDRAALCEAVRGANSLEELLAKLGYQIALIRQIHVQDAYSRLGPAGGIRAVLPYHDIPTKSSMPTLINFNSTVTATPQSADFFNKMLGAFKAQLQSKE